MIGVSPFIRKRHGASSPAAPLGDLFVETFNPQIGNYTNLGSASTVVTAGNMAVSGGNGTPSNMVVLNDVVWNANNFYYKTRYDHTNTNFNQFGLYQGLNSTVLNGNYYHCYWGFYYFDGANSSKLQISTQNADTGYVDIAFSATGLTINPGDIINVTSQLVENILTITGTNETTLQSINLSYTFNLTYPQTNFKPNTGKFVMFAPVSTCNIKEIIVGTNYLVGVDRLFDGDSITAGLFATSVANRYPNLYSTASGKTIAVFAGIADKSSNSISHLSYSTLLTPQKVHILIGTNDILHGVLPSTVIANVQTMINAYQAVGASVFVGTLLPLNGQNNLPMNALINGLTGVTIVDYYTALEDPMSPGNLNPLYDSGDDVHPNAAGEVVMKDLLIALGF